MPRNPSTLMENPMSDQSSEAPISNGASSGEATLQEPQLADVASPGEGHESAMEAFDDGAPVDGATGDDGALPGVEPLPEYTPISDVAGNESAEEVTPKDADFGSGAEGQEFWGAVLAALPTVYKYAKKIPVVRRTGNRILHRLGIESDAVGVADEPKSLLEVVIGVDDRIKINNTTVAPWNGICHLSITSRTGQKYIGTGWFIGPRTIITAGHCVYLHGAGGWAANIEVSAGRNGTTFPFGKVTSSNFRALTAWTRDKNRNYDYGCIILPTAPKMNGRPTFAFNFGALGDAALKARAMNLCGYPGDKGGTTQWFHARMAQSVTPFTINYDIDTAGGQSGSPVWQYNNGVRTAVGIHTNGAPLGNSATRITPAVAAMLQNWKTLGS